MAPGSGEGRLSEQKAWGREENEENYPVFDVTAGAAACCAGGGLPSPSSPPWEKAGGEEAIPLPLVSCCQ